MHLFPTIAVKAAHVDFTASFDASLSSYGHHLHAKPQVFSEVDQLWVLNANTAEGCLS